MIDGAFDRIVQHGVQDLLDACIIRHDPRVITVDVDLDLFAALLILKELFQGLSELDWLERRLRSCKRLL